MTPILDAKHSNQRLNSILLQNQKNHTEKLYFKYFLCSGHHRHLIILLLVHKLKLSKHETKLKKLEIKLFRGVVNRFPPIMQRYVATTQYMPHANLTPLLCLLEGPRQQLANLFSECPGGHRGPMQSLSQNHLLHEGERGDINPRSVWNQEPIREMAGNYFSNYSTTLITSTTNYRDAGNRWGRPQ